MTYEFPWLGQCLNHFEVTNVGASHDFYEDYILAPCNFSVF